MNKNQSEENSPACVQLKGKAKLINAAWEVRFASKVDAIVKAKFTGEIYIVVMRFVSYHNEEEVEARERD